MAFKGHCSGQKERVTRSYQTEFEQRAILEKRS
jgi:hypothetical protein